MRKAISGVISTFLLPRHCLAHAGNGAEVTCLCLHQLTTLLACHSCL